MTATAPQTSGPAFELVALEDLRESPFNTRKRFDPATMGELRASIERSGLLNPILVRPLRDGVVEPFAFEIAGGHRRYRAAKEAGLAEVPCLVREMDDATFLEVLTIDNLQREDVHPLEEAQGYKNLLTIDGYDVAKIAQRVGKSESYVYDRLKLLQLIKPAQKLFLEDRFTAGHAILLARLSKADQEKCLGVDDEDAVNRYDWRSNRRGGMWRGEYGGHDPVGVQETLGIAEEDGERMHPVSVRELQAWIDDHVRFTAPDPQLPHLFADTTEQLAQAQAEKAKVIEISRDYRVQDDAKREDGKRTFCVSSWKRADGKPESEFDDEEGAPSKTCEYSVLGLVVAGRGRGESFQVCIDKKRCLVHWKAEIQERNRREREREKAEAKGGSPASKNGPAPKELTHVERVQQAIEGAKAAAELEAENKAEPAVLEAIAKALRTAPTGASSPIANALFNDWLIDGTYGLTGHAKEATKAGVPRGSSAGDFLRHVAMCVLIGELRQDWDAIEACQNLLDHLKLGVKLEKIFEPFRKAAAAAVEKKFAKDLETAREEDRDDAAAKKAGSKKPAKKGSKK